MTIRTPLFAVILFPLASACAVATIDDPVDTDEAADDQLVLDGDGSLSTTSSGSVVVTGSGGTAASGGSASSSTGGSSTGGTSSGPNPGPSPGSPTGGSGGTDTPDPGDMGPTEPVVDPGGCKALGHQEDSGEFGTTGPACFIVDYSEQMYGWRASNAGGRTVTVNGEVVGTGDTSSGAVPWPGGAPYLVEFSAGDTANTTWAFW